MANLKAIAIAAKYRDLTDMVARPARVRGILLRK
jgi:hypothetical protein